MVRGTDSFTVTFLIQYWNVQKIDRMGSTLAPTLADAFLCHHLVEEESSSELQDLVQDELLVKESSSELQDFLHDELLVKESSSGLQDLLHDELLVKESCSELQEIVSTIYIGR